MSCHQPACYMHAGKVVPAYRCPIHQCRFTQILFVAGVAMTIGTQATIRFFIRRKNYKVGDAVNSCGISNFSVQQVSR